MLYMYMYVGVWFVFEVILIFCNLFAFGVLKEGFDNGLTMVGDGIMVVWLWCVLARAVMVVFSLFFY